jgi:hypothetical protein
MIHTRTLTNAGTKKTIYQEKQAFQIESWTPHILFFLQDTIIAEWWQADEFQCYYYHPYRKIIDVQNSLVARENETSLLHSTGHNQRLVPQDEATLAAAMTRSGTLVGRLGVLLLVTVAAAVGVVAGISMGMAMGEGTASSSEGLRESVRSSSSQK